MPPPLGRGHYLIIFREGPHMSGFKKGLKSTINVYDKILCVVGVVFYVLFCVCVLIQVVSRNFLPKSPSWTEEAARYSFIYMVAFGCGVAVHRREFVKVEFLYDALEARGHNKANKIISLIIDILVCALCIFLLFKAVIPFAFIKFKMFSTAMTIPMQYVYFAIVLCFSFLSLSFILEILNTILTWNDPEETEAVK